MAASEELLSKRYKKYSSDQLLLAVSSVKSGQKTVSDASKTFQVPANTISRRARRLPNFKVEPRSVLNIEEEQHLKEFMFKCAKNGYACSNKVLIESALHIIWSRKDKTMRNVQNLTRGWIQSFLQRHKDISKRTPQMVTKASAPVTKQNLLDYYDRVKACTDADGLSHIWEDQRRIFAGDETGVALNPKEGKVYGKKGVKQLVQIANNQEKVQVTVMYNFQATGEMLPPFILYKKTNKFEEISMEMPDDYLFHFCESGWMDTDSFCHNMVEISKYCINQNIPFPVFYIIDGHRSHTSLQTLEKATELGIVLIVQYPNSTRINQMADKVMFNPIKTAWNELMFDYRRKTQTGNFSIELFAPMLKKANDRAVTSDLVKTGFKVTGWYPFDKNAVDYSLCLTENLDEQTEDVIVVTETTIQQSQENDLDQQLRLMEEKLTQLKKKALEASSVNTLWGEISDLGIKIESLSHPISPVDHFPALRDVLEVPKPPKRKGNRNYQLNLLPTLNGSESRKMIEERDKKADEIQSMKADKRVLEQEIKNLRLLIIAEKKEAPRKKRGQAVLESELEVDLRDRIHRKSLMQMRLKELMKKPSQEVNINDSSEQTNEDIENEEPREEENIQGEEIECNFIRSVLLPRQDQLNAVRPKRSCQDKREKPAKKLRQNKQRI